MPSSSNVHVTLLELQHSLENMTLHLLRDIPREIRDQIYSWVLTSPSGCVSLQPASAHYFFNSTPRINIVPVDPDTYERLASEPAIRLTLLRICSQIHIEARHALWRRNSLAFPVGQSLYSHSKLIDPRFSYSIKSVQLGVSLLSNSSRHYFTGSWSGSSSMEGALKIFGSWARGGSLRFLTLTIVTGHKFESGMAGLNKLLEARGIVGQPSVVPKSSHDTSSFKEHLSKLEEADSYLPAELKRKIVFNPSWNALDVTEKRAWIKDRAAFQPQGLIKEIHDKFGGEFWMDGKLCFRNHDEIEHVFDV